MNYMFIFQNGELAAIMKEKHVGNPRRDSAGMLVNQHLGTTDVTQEVSQSQITIMTFDPRASFCIHDRMIERKTVL